MKTRAGKIDFLRNCMSESTACFFLIINNFIFTHIFAIKILKMNKNFLAIKKVLNGRSYSALLGVGKSEQQTKSKFNLMVFTETTRKPKQNLIPPTWE